jgi:uncharacterized protein
MPLFVLELEFPPERARRLAVRPDHRAYLEQLKTAGKVVAAGPWNDDSGALIVYDAIDEAEVAGVLAEDPYVTEGVSGERTVRCWQPILGGRITVG